jgi:hypothetical protein
MTPLMALLTITDLVDIARIMDENGVDFNTLTSINDCMKEINEHIDPQ